MGNQNMTLIHEIGVLYFSNVYPGNNVNAKKTEILSNNLE